MGNEKIRITVDKADLKALREGISALRAASWQWILVKNQAEADRISSHADRLGKLAQQVQQRMM